MCLSKDLRTDTWVCPEEPLPVVTAVLAGVVVMTLAAAVQTGAEHGQQRAPAVLAGAGAPARDGVHGARLLVALQSRPAASVRLAAALARHALTRGQRAALRLAGTRRVQLLHGRHAARLARFSAAEKYAVFRRECHRKLESKLQRNL